MRKIDDMRIYIMAQIKKHKDINASAIGEKFGIDRHTVVKHFKELTNQISKIPRKKRKCGLLEIIGNYEEMILDPTIKLKATYMFILNQNSIEVIGTYSNFVQYVRKHYGKQRRIKRMGLPKFRYETSPGELLQFDWIEDLKIELLTGEIIKFNLWSGTLAYSREHFFKPVMGKTTEDFKKCLIDNLIVIGGRPDKIMTDNMSAIINIIKGKRNIHPDVYQFLNDLNIKLVICKPRHPFTKGKVEVSNKYQNWIKPYNKKFATIDEALQIIPLIMMQCNYQVNSETNLAPIKLFNIKEKYALKDLPSPDLLRSYYGTSKKVFVNNSCLIKHQNASYSVPEEYCGKEVYIIDKDGIIEIFDLYMNHVITYSHHEYGIHYLKSMYDVHKRNLPKGMSEEVYDQMVEKNLDLLANLGGKF